MLVQAAGNSTMPVFLLGDFNHSPALPSRGIQPELAGNYEWLVSQGFASVYVMRNGSCTWCEANSLISHNDFNADSAIMDHVYVRRAVLNRAMSAKVSQAFVLHSMHPPPLLDQYPCYTENI